MSPLKNEVRNLFRQNDQVFDFLSKEALDGLAIREIGGDERFWANEIFWGRLGYKPKNVKANIQFWRNCLHPEDQDLEQRTFRLHADHPEKHNYNLVLRYYHREGGLVWMQVNGHLIREENGLTKRMLLSFKEMSALKNQEDFLNRSSEMARIGYYDWNIRTKELNWSAVTKEIHGVSADFKPDFRLALKFYKEGRSRQKITELIDRAQHFGEPFDEVLQIVDSHGKDIWVRVIGIPEIQEGRALRLYGMFQDIDISIRTQNAIRSERELYRQVLQGANVGAWDWDIDSDQMTLNRKAAEMLGYDLEVMRREGQVYWFDLIHPDEKSRVMQELMEYSVGKLHDFQTECRLRKSNGRYRWLQISGKLFQPDLHFERPRIVGIWTDIHHEKERLLSYSTFIQEAPLAIAMFDRNMRYINCSHKWLIDYKLEGQDIIGRSHYDVFPEISDEWKQLHLRCLAGETLNREEDLFRRMDGHAQWIRWEIRPWYESKDQVGGIIMYTEDISGRKEAEFKLRKSQKSFEQNFTNSAIGMAIIGRKGEWLQVNDKICQMLGYSSEELSAKTFQELTHPDDLEKDLLLLEKLNRGEIDNYQVEKRYFRKDGTVLSALLGATVLRDDQGEVDHYISQIIACKE